jgi:hypothetical protein
VFRTELIVLINSYLKLKQTCRKWPVIPILIIIRTLVTFIISVSLNTKDNCNCWMCRSVIVHWLVWRAFSHLLISLASTFLAHLSWKLKWAILIARCPSVCLSVNFYIFDFSRTTGPILTKLAQIILGGGIQVYSNEGDCPSPRGDNSKRVKIHWKFLNIFFSRTSRPNSIKLGTHYPWVKGIQVCSNKGPGPLLRGDNHKNVKKAWRYLVMYLSL